MNAVAELYDQLFAFESRKKKGPYPIHKKLAFGTGKDLTSWLLENVDFREGDSMLDAGCGTGNMLFRIAESTNIKGLGISLSAGEINYAKSFLAESDFSLEFSQRSYDEPFSHQFDKIIAIESLKHSPDLGHTLKNLLDALKPGGILIIVDDFLIFQTKNSAYHKTLWEATSFVSTDHLLKEIAGINGVVVSQTDFTRYVPHRPEWMIRIVSVWATIFRRITSGSLHRNLTTYLGGLTLEMMYSRKEATYQVLVLKKTA